MFMVVVIFYDAMDALFGNISVYLYDTKNSKCHAIS
jgi:hypothetical protein